tara:strand:+ start:184 stop:474 length:291 start_codon:yes stop_codon:yes gene_type:complete
MNNPMDNTMNNPIDNLTARDFLGSTQPRSESEVTLLLPFAAAKLRREAKTERLTLKEVQQRYNPDGCVAIALTLAQMLTPWTPSSTLAHLNLWGAA